MKRIIYYILLFTAVMLTATVFMGCEDESGDIEVRDGKPAIRYIRTLGLDCADSIITGARQNTVICIVGNNLRCVRKMYFNDKEAVLVPFLITENTLIVTVPNVTPNEVSNKIYLLNNANDTTTFNFKVLKP